MKKFQKESESEPDSESSEEEKKSKKKRKKTSLPSAGYVKHIYFMSESSHVRNKNQRFIPGCDFKVKMGRVTLSEIAKIEMQH